MCVGGVLVNNGFLAVLLVLLLVSWLLPAATAIPRTCQNVNQTPHASASTLVSNSTVRDVEIPPPKSMAKPFNASISQVSINNESRRLKLLLAKVQF